MPWTAYCADMASTPAEYLTLQQTGGSSNFSQYTGGGATPGTTVRTYYFKLRINPLTMRVNTADQRFTTSSGQLVHGGQTVTSMPFGTAMSCDASASGRANIDLTGTPFAVAANPFKIGGGTYTVTYSLTDSGGNSAAPVTRTVDVVNCPW